MHSTPPPSVMLFIRSQLLQGCWGGDLGQPTLCPTLPRRFNSFQLAHEDGVLPSRSCVRTLRAFTGAAAPPRSHSFRNSTPSRASWYHGNSCSKFSQEEGKRDSYSRSLSLLSLSLSLLSPSHLILSSAFFCVSESSNSSSVLLFSL